MTFTSDCETIRRQLTDNQRRDLDNGIARIANDPYGCGSSPTYDKDRREATCGSVFVGYQVSANVLRVTVVRVYAP
ncbi:hypothetical protein [Streptomyces sp. SID3343]|uniref:hypothetical protein n=1 Tax=Streptomyces sp. SID3343 TaxID=2690260 RepID=UPI0013C23A2E|nr:hypothetical protein [Streptomyces sp. SID3343]MYW04068.1 hypothetical protein [Streptomyces sp. SID3343]